jgi:hypothetical protein
VFEYTEDVIAARFQTLNDEQLKGLCALPTIFAYETGIGEDAQFGHVRKVRFLSKHLEIEYELARDASPIPHDLLIAEAVALDVAGWELSRTHWAIKDVDLGRFLEKHQLIQERESREPDFAGLPAAETIPIQPSVFRVPTEPADASLVAMMMPFTAELDGMLQEVTKQCAALGLSCLTARQVWENEEIIQDIFSLIYRSRFVICDFSGQNANVFYEAGIAHTLGKPLIPIAQNLADLPFDLRHHRAVLYHNNTEGLAALGAQLRPRLEWLIQH